MTDNSDDDPFFNGDNSHTALGGRFHNFEGEAMRIISREMDAQPAFQHAVIKHQEILRETPKARQKIRATFFEADRHTNVVTIQRINPVSGPHKDFSFSFVGDEIQQLKEFLAGIETVDVQNPRARRIDDDELHEIVLNQSQINRLVAQDPSLVTEIIENADLRRDVVAVKYRTDQRNTFEKLLNDGSFFEQKMEQHKVGKPERLWQKFFERNTWIFGYGLSYQFLSGLDRKKLEQTVSGFDLGTGFGKTADGVMKTRGAISSICLVEIKTHQTPLLSSDQKRSGVWHPSSHLSAAIAQIQVTVQSALEDLQDILRPKLKSGDPTGELLFNVAPRSFLIVGQLSEFEAVMGVNSEKFKSFELYRRNMHRPEIVTFDELYDRARFIVRQNS